MNNRELAKLQQSLMHFVMGEDSDIHKNIIDQGNVTVRTRLGIYKNAYRARLRETIDTDHDVLGAYLGDNLFDQMVEQYVTQNPSRSTSLRQYADSLPRFLARISPFCEYPVISELACFERMLLIAFDAAQQPVFTQEQLQQVPDQQWPSMQLQFQPGFQLFQTQWNTVEIWQALKAKQVPPDVVRQDQQWMIWRNPERLTEFRSVNKEEAGLVQSVLQGASMQMLCQYLLDYVGEEQASHIIVQYLQQWIEQGSLVSIQNTLTSIYQH